MKYKPPRNIYRSKRIKGNQKGLFEEKPKAGSIIDKNISTSLYCQIPLVLYTDKEGTYPKMSGPKDEPCGLLANVTVPKTSHLKLSYVRLSASVMGWR